MAVFTGQVGVEDDFVGADGVFDTFRFAVAALETGDSVQGGTGSDRLQFTTGGTVTAALLDQIVEVDRILLAAAGNAITLSDTFAQQAGAAGRVFVTGLAGNDTVDASGFLGTSRLDVTAGSGDDTLTGGAGADAFRFAAADLTSADAVVGGGGSDTLVLTTAGTVAAGGFDQVSGIERIILSAGGSGITLGAAFAAGLTAARIVVTGGAGSDTLLLTTAGTLATTALDQVSGIERIGLAAGGNAITLSAAFAAGLTSGRIVVTGGAGSDTVDASAFAAPAWIDVTLATGADTVTGGAGNDVIRVAASALTSADAIDGGAGTDVLQITSAGTLAADALDGVAGIERLLLAAGGNGVTLSAAFAAAMTGPTLTVYGGAGNDSVNASAFDAGHAVLIIAGAGSDLLGGGAGNDEFRVAVNDLDANDTFAGGGGVDTLRLTTGGEVAASNLILNEVERIVLSAAGNVLTLTDWHGAAIGPSLTVVATAGSDNTVNASSFASTTRLIVDVTTTGAPLGYQTLTGGAGDDEFRFAAEALSGVISGGGGTDTIVLASSGAVATHALSGHTGIERLVLAEGGNEVTIHNTSIAPFGTWFIVGGQTGTDVVDASGLISIKAVIVEAGGGTDTLLGGAGNDEFQFAAADLTSADQVTGGGGDDVVRITTAGALASDALDGVAGIERLILAAGGNDLTLSATFAAALTGSSITVEGGAGDDAVDASAVDAAHAVLVLAGTGADALTGGAGDDEFQFAAADLTSADQVTGGGGDDLLRITTAGALASDALDGVADIDRLVLAAGGNDLTLSATFAAALTGSSITVEGGAGDDTVDASAFDAGHAVLVLAGTGTDTLTGGAASDEFRFAGGALGAGDAVTGGLGFDRVRIDGAGAADAAAGSLDQIEELVLGTGDQALTVAQTAVNDADDNTLVVRGSAGDSVATSDTGWLFSGLGMAGGEEVALYTKGGATLAVETDIDRSGIQTTSAFGTSVTTAGFARQVIDLTSLTAAQGFIIQGDAPVDYAGWSVSSAGDVNGDGFADLIVGARWGDDGGYAAGEAYVVFGKAAGFGTTMTTGGFARQVIDLTSLSAADGFIIQGDAVDDQAGWSVSSAGDVNGDGFADLMVGAPRANGINDDEGEAYVVFGKAGGFGST